ncbi:beta-ketoacyl synthase N-terminal-like domain-containing protein, partial [Streptomyces sp. NPDC051644]|uniref:beta-ketoacyl reductase n=1 Tax=Streptomyces sp. NPDC051644 TaxID=3365666 RepID=UPI0037B27A93
MVAEFPPSAVVHAAGVLDDGVVEGLSVGQVEGVLRPKAWGGEWLHEVTSGLSLRAFVVFSSLAGVLGSVGQANYAAANAWVDGLVHRRRASGLPGVSLAWGLWSDVSGMTGGMGGGDRERLARSGIAPMTSQEALALFDAALRSDSTCLVPARMDTVALRKLAQRDALPPILRGLVRTRARRTADSSAGAVTGSSLQRQLQSLTEAEQLTTLLDIVREAVAGVLAIDRPRSIDTSRAFKELGFDSLTSLELRNRLGEVTGLRLPAGLVFDHPTPDALAEFLRGELLGRDEGAVVVRSGVVDEPVAVVGMSCRFPGGVSSPEELWELLERGGETRGGFPAGRGWDLESLYHPDPDHAGTTYTRFGSFLHEAGEFDAGFFGLSPREALATDPQQRLLLETAWEAVERAG